MNKIAFMLAYSEPEKALSLYMEHFSDSDDFEKTASINKEAFLGKATQWLKDSYAKNPKMWHGIGGAALGAGAGYMMGGGRGALLGAGLGGLGGYYSSPYLQKYMAKLQSMGQGTPQSSGTLPANYPGHPGTPGSMPSNNYSFDPNVVKKLYQIQGMPQRGY